MQHHPLTHAEAEIPCPLHPNEQIDSTLRHILAKGNHCPAECLNLVRKLTVTAIPGNGPFAILLIFAIAGTPPPSVAGVSLTHDFHGISCFIDTGLKLSAKDVDALRACACSLAGVYDYHVIPSTFRWESDVKDPRTEVAIPKSV